jgi:hypothetical protein
MSLVRARGAICASIRRKMPNIFYVSYARDKVDIWENREGMLENIENSLTFDPPSFGSLAPERPERVTERRLRER